MPWGRLEDTLHDNGKVDELSDRAFRVWVYSISYCNRKRREDPEGRLTAAEAANLCRRCRATPRQIPGLLAELTGPHGLRATPFWEPEEDACYVVHDFPDFAPREDKTAADRKRAERDRRRAVTRDAEESHADVTDDSPMRGRPGPVPVPGPVPGTPEQTEEVGQTLSPQQPARGSVLALNGQSGSYSASFEAFWAEYPRKIEKHAAWLAWERALKVGAVADELIGAARHLAAYVDEQGTEDRYVPHAATFLGPQRKWQDFVAGVPVPSRKRKSGGLAAKLGVTDRAVANLKAAGR